MVVLFNNLEPWDGGLGGRFPPCQEGGDIRIHGCMCAQSFPTFWSPLDCSPPSSSVHGILQARKLEQVAISFSRNLCFLCLLHWQVNCLQSTVAETLRLSPNKCRHNSLQQAILPYFKGLKKMFGMIKHLVIPVHCLSVTLMR